MIKIIKNFLKDLNPVSFDLASNQPFNLADFQRSRQIKMLKFICTLGILFLSIFSGIVIYEQRAAIVLIDLTMALILVAIIYLANTSTTLNPVKMTFLGVFFLGIFFFYLFFSPFSKDVGFIWFFTYPLLAFFLLGMKMGLVMSLLLMAATLLGIIFIQKTFIYGLTIRIFGVYIAIGVLSFTFEWIRAHTEAQLILNNQRLEKMLHDLSVAEQSAQDSRKKYRDLVETVKDWIWETDADGKIVFSSPQVEEILGYPPEQIVGKSFVDLAPEELRYRASQLITEIISNKQSIAGLEGKLLHQNGTSVVIESSGIPIFDGAGRFSGFRAVTRDVTIKRKARNEHEQRRKLQGALELAGAVCHELNQPMMAINGYAELLMVKGDVDPIIGNSLDKIRRQTERMGSITRKLMSITRYETRKYTGGETIMDIDKSSDK